jgi:Raf kinase inhibitor-like YbhB/YbcL family protein
MQAVLRRSVLMGCLALASGVRADPAMFSVSSPDFVPGHPVPEKNVLNAYGCHGQNRSPALSWKNVPPGTKSFAVTLFDLDEHATPSGWWHWVVYDIPGSATGLPENAGAEHSTTLPAGAVQGRTDLSQDAYHGPCPAQGDPPHRYLITVYALKVAKLDVPPESTGAMVSWFAHDSMLAKATLTVRHGR